MPTSSVLDLGCNECSLVKYLKQLPFLTQINCVDISSFNLERSHSNLKVGVNDFLIERTHQQTVNLYLGSALEKDSRFGQTDVVTCVELIEHLQPEMIPDLAANVFENIQPKVAIFSTPNFDYNCLIHCEIMRAEGAYIETPKYRDRDHKFEWTRDEFATWCNGIIEKYPIYTVEIDGVGILDSDDKRQTGFCTQIAIFTKKQDTKNETCSLVENEIYKLFKTYTYKENIRTENGNNNVI